ncbi:IclR family transcriptional regulator C-terminal domain-containing protein, partial [uncultured Microbacterium sp.]
EHTQLAILEQDEALFLERLSAPDSGANITRVAGRLPLHASSSGLVLLAFAPHDLQERVLAAPLARVTADTIVDPAALRRTLAEIRTLGRVIAPGYVDAVSTGVAVPVRDETGAVIAALSAVLPRDAETQFALVELHRAARDTERALGFRR